ncbi:hypothetical protein REPUB_Repub13aG0120800 [Reevesia pubescens]
MKKTQNPKREKEEKISKKSNTKTQTKESEIFASCSFSSLGLHSTLSDQLRERLGFEAPTVVQAQAIPVILSGRHVLVNAETGSGKTIAYLAPIIHHLQGYSPRIERSHGTFVIVNSNWRWSFVPTRELCLQVYEILQKLLHRFHWIVPGYVMGGENRNKEKARLRKGISILIATPGRLLDHLKNTSSFVHANLRWIIFDEADRILELGFGKDIEEILDLLGSRENEPVGKEKSSEFQRQNLLLSATLNEKVNHLAKISLENPVMIGLDNMKMQSHSAVNQTGSLGSDVDEDLDNSSKFLSSSSGDYKLPAQLVQRYVKVPCGSRLAVLISILKHLFEREASQKIVVFFSTCDAVDFHYTLLNEFQWSPYSQFEAELKQLFLKCKTFRLHGNMKQEDRRTTFSAFKTEKSALLVSTDVAARGLDFPKVRCIIQYDSPGEATEYVHRVGRTARLGERGESLLFLQPIEVDYLQDLEKHVWRQGNFTSSPWNLLRRDLRAVMMTGCKWVVFNSNLPSDGLMAMIWFVFGCEVATYQHSSFVCHPNIKIHPKYLKLSQLNADDSCNNAEMHPTLRLSCQISHCQSCHLSPALLNSNIKAFIQQGQFNKALQLYSVSPVSASQFTFPSLLKASTFLSNLTYGKTLHSTIIQFGIQFDPFITTSLINMYVKCGSFSYAVNVFEKTVEREVFVKDVTFWNSLLDGYFKFGKIKEGLAHFYKMQAFGVLRDAYSLSILLGVLGYKDGKQIHGYIVRNMFKSDPFLETALINMYSSCNRIMEAWFVFDHLEDKSNVVVWNVMIGAFFENGWWEWSLKLYSLMKGENVKFVSESFSSTLSACGHGGVVDFGRQVHCDLIKLAFENNPFVYTSLLTMYGKCQFVQDAEKVFYQVLDKGIELWNAIISTFVCNGYSYAAFEVYNRMRYNAITPDSFTVSNVLSCSSMIGIYNVGRSVHVELVKRPIESSTAVQSALLTMYCKCGSVDDANCVLRTMREKDVVAWGSMISGFCQNRMFREALDYFGRMDADGVRPDSDTMSSVISACTGLENVDSGCMIHGYVIKSGLDRDIYVATSLVDMYSKCGLPDMAENVFFDMPHKNIVAWNSMMSCYCRNGLPDQSIKLFSKIVQHGFYPDSISITSVLAAVSSIAALLNGKIIHGYLVRLEIESDIQLENALIDMYIKCGFLKYAEYIFQNMSQKDVVTWNCMIAGYGSHGDCLQALSLFEEMKNSGITPDDVTFLSLISSCNHAGLVDEGQNIVQSMTVEHGIEPKMEHYVNIVDLLGRAGRLEEAYNFVKTIPMEPDRSVWLSLLCASRIHSNLELGELAAHNLLKVEPDRGSNYVQLLHLYGEADLWNKAANVRATMKEKGLKKNPGCSWIELRNTVDVFFSGDSSSLKTMKIYEILHSLGRNMDKKGGDYEIVMAFLDLEV